MDFIAFGYYEVWTGFCFHISLAQVLPHDAEHCELNASNEYDDADCGRPAGDRVTEGEAPYNDEQQRDDRDERQHRSKESRDVKWREGETDDAINSVFEQSPEVPLSLACDALYIFKRQPVCSEADPSVDTL